VHMPPDVKSLLEWYSLVLRQGEIATAGTGAAFLLAFLALRYGPDGLRHWAGVVGVIGLVGEVSGVHAQEQARNAIVASVAGGLSQLGDDGVAD
jgi:hypothetical protein